MNVRQSPACVWEVSVSTVMDPLLVNVLRAKCETLNQMHVRTVMNVRMKILASTAGVLTLMAAFTAAVTVATSPLRTAGAA